MPQEAIRRPADEPLPRDRGGFPVPPDRLDSSLPTFFFGSVIYLSLLLLHDSAHDRSETDEACRRIAGLRAIREGAEVALTGLILAEILQGVPSDSEFAKLRKVLSSFRVFRPGSGETYVRAARLSRPGRKGGGALA